MAFQALEALPGVYHIKDALGVCMTLLVGSERALLVDTGYGLEDVSAFVRSLTDRPVTVMLTHGHHDHALGSRWFSQVYVLPEDRDVYAVYTGDLWRRRVWESAQARGFTDEEAFMAASMPAALPLAAGDMDLGGLTARVIPCPGHTPGSAVVYVPERELLLTGDDWNPCTWLFFPEALPARAYRAQAEGLLALPFRHALCSHQWRLFDRDMPESFIRGLTDEVLDRAVPVDAGARVGKNAAQAALPEGQVFVFDWDKYVSEREGA